jgi:hypothetical protein
MRSAVNGVQFSMAKGGQKILSVPGLSRVYSKSNTLRAPSVKPH